MCLTLPETLITVVGIEKIVPTWADLEVFLQLLPRSSTGERMNPYTSMWTGVTPGDGPQDVHVVLLDNGRTDVLADAVGRQALRCIRCSACLNVCPVYERTGGRPTARCTPARSARSSRQCCAASGTMRRLTHCPMRRRCAVRATTSARWRSTSPRCWSICGRRSSMRTVGAYRTGRTPQWVAAWTLGSPRRLRLAERAASLSGRLTSRLDAVAHQEDEQCWEGRRGRRRSGPTLVICRRRRQSRSVPGGAYRRRPSRFRAAPMSARDEILGRVLGGTRQHRRAAGTGLLGVRQVNHPQRRHGSVRRTRSRLPLRRPSLFR